MTTSGYIHPLVHVNRSDRTADPFCGCHEDPWPLCPRWRDWGYTPDEHAEAERRAAAAMAKETDMTDLESGPAELGDMGKPPADTSWIKMTTIREGRQPLTEDETFERTDQGLIALCVFIAGAAFGVLLAAAGVWLSS